MNLFARSLLLRTLVIPMVLMGCGSDEATGPKTGDVILGVTGLPLGSSGDITVTGPNGFSAAVTATDTLAGLVPGSYVVEARRVTFAGDDYAAPQDRQTITVAAAKVPMNATVGYAIASGRLTISVSGLPGSPGSALSVTGPNGFARTLTGPTTLTRLVPGLYTLTAISVTSGLQVYVPDQPERTVTVTASQTPASVMVAFAATTGLNLIIDGLHITQSVQRYDGSIPLVRGRDGYLRIFGRANISNGAVPPVRVRLYQNGAVVRDVRIPAGASSVPEAIDQGILGTSWNLPVEGALIQPGLSVLAEIDPDNEVV